MKSTFKVEGARHRARPRKRWKEVVDKDVNDLLLKSSDVTDRCKWREMIGRNWSDSCSDSHAESSI